MFEVHICGFFQIQCLDGAYLSQILRYLPKKSIIMTFACFISTACITTSQMCPLKSFVPPGMPAVPGRLMDRGSHSILATGGIQNLWVLPFCQDRMAVAPHLEVLNPFYRGNKAESRISWKKIHEKAVEKR